MLVPLPAPLGLVFLGKCYLALTSFCFVSMANGVNLTDGLDGLAGGTTALAFIGMSIAVLPICSSEFGCHLANNMNSNGSFPWNLTFEKLYSCLV